MPSETTTSLKKRLIDLLIILGVSVCLLLFIEAVIRVFWSQKSEVKFLTHGAAVNMDSAKFTFRLKPNVKYTQTNPEFSLTYSTNAEGFRDQSVYLNKERDPTKVRILALGDSFTFGVGSEYEDTWLAKLEKELKVYGKSIEIIKAGMPAYNQFHEYYLMVDVIGLYKPSYVFVGFAPNDLFDNKPLDEVSAPTNLTPAAEAGSNGKVRHAASAWRFNYQTLDLGKRLMLRIDKIYTRTYEHTDRIEFFKNTNHLEPRVKRQYEVTAELFHRIKLVCDANKAGLVVISIPQQYQVLKNDQSKDIDVYGIDKYFSEKASERGYIWITSLSEFREQAKNQPEYYRVDGHLTPFGNTVLANAVVKKFLQSGSEFSNLMNSTSNIE